MENEAGTAGHSVLLCVHCGKLAGLRLVFLELVTYGLSLRQNMMRSGDFLLHPSLKKKLEKFSPGAHDDKDEVNQDESSILASGELIPDSDGTDFDGGDGEDYRDSADFENEVEATFRRALAGVYVQNVILEISSYDCAGALFYAIMKSSSALPYSNNAELSANTKKEINKWKNLLKNHIKSQDEEIEVIMKFEEICLETIREFHPLFTNILHHLYDEEILAEDAIFSWENEKEGADESDKIYVKQAEPFIKWLKEAAK